MSRIVAVILFAVALTTAISCGSSADSRKKDPFLALNYPPFDGITDSIKKFPDNAVLYLRRASLLSQSKLQDLATPDYKKAWELTRDEGVELEYISNLLLTNQVDSSIRLLKEGTAQFPENREFNRRLGEVYLQQQQPDSAMRQFNIILSKDSSNFEAWYDKGTLLATLKDTTGATQALERSFALMPINYSGMALAGIYAAQKKSAGAADM